MATAIIQYIIDAWGRGWTYTFIALIYGVFSPALWIIEKYGPQWREERMEKAKEAIEKKEKEAREKAMTTTEQVLTETQPTSR